MRSNRFSTTLVIANTQLNGNVSLRAYLRNEGTIDVRQTISRSRWPLWLWYGWILACLLLAGCADSKASGPPAQGTETQTKSTVKPILPGQETWKNNVSSYLFGTNDSIEWTPNNIETMPTIQSMMKSAGIPLIRSFFFSTISDKDIDQRIGTIEKIGAQCLVVLPDYDNQAFNEHVVRYLGSRCLMYEFGNEANYNHHTMQDYIAQWNKQIPLLRQLNSKAKFFGPTLSNINIETNNEKSSPRFLSAYLASIKSSKVLPDVLSIHWYPCWQNTEADCLGKASEIGSIVTQLRQNVRASLGQDLPIAVTEWNFDPNAPPPAYGNKTDFITKFTRDALNAMIQAGVIMACQYAAGSYTGYGGLDMFDVITGQPKPQFQTIKELIQTYKQGPTVSGGNGLLVSRGKPAFCQNNENAGGPQSINDGQYGNWGKWDATQQSLPTWCAIHLDKGPSKLLFIWVCDYQFDYINENGAGPGAYTIAVSDDSTDGSDGHWKTLVSVTGNATRVREHLLDFSGESWVKMTVTQLSAKPLRGDFAIDELEAYDVSQNADDSYFFSGDSITAMAYNRYPEDQPSFAEDVHKAFPQRFPAMLDAGLGGWNSQGAVEHIDEWLQLNPDIHYWLLQWGTNDALGQVPPEKYEANIRQLVQKIKQAGHIPILAHIPSMNRPGGDNTAVNTLIQSYNTALDRVTKDEGLISGPDLYKLFSQHKEYFLPDGIHPTAVGAIAMNNAWFEAVRTKIN
ncbi:hypothetical protein KSD_37270 [Ktedonobacter sp. SOSP1-85]|nr:hypothetical protein KSD_37270 [Ktedonobacter sp. SOSP1-85]